MWLTIDARDVIYAALGLALVGLTLQPALARFRALNFPLLYVLLGVGLAALGLEGPDPLGSDRGAKVVEHFAELVVIVSLMGAGLAIDTPLDWRRWGTVWRLLAITMPLSVAAVAALGWGVLGLGLGSALLVAAVLAPTDPVLAQSVRVAPPGEGDGDMEFALTAAAGLNDGLAFPFVALAIGLASHGLGEPLGWLGEWALFDVGWRVLAGLAMGYLGGRAVAGVGFSRWGDAKQGAPNSVVMVLGGTLLVYGVTEAVDGYGFLAVFCAARVWRARAREEEHDQPRGHDGEGHERLLHHGADQLEGVLMAVGMVWLGTFLMTRVLGELDWREAAFAVGLVLVVRPALGLLAVLRRGAPGLKCAKVAFFGVRGLGTVFYLAYGHTHATFEDLDVVWRVAALTILVSVVVHGYASNLLLEPDEDESHPAKDAADHRTPPLTR